MAPPSEPLPPQRLDRTITAYRIGDPAGEHPIFDAAGSRLYPGRWNVAEAPVIYASEHYSTALLEKLARGNGILPRNQHFIAVTLPRGATFETASPDRVPGWDSLEPAASRSFGREWALTRRSLLLRVPSFVARLDWNWVINPAHPEFGTIETSLPQPVWWDERLFRAGR